MNCTKCGKEIPDGENKLCDECKNSLLSDIGNEEDNKFEIKKDQKRKDQERSGKEGSEKERTKNRQKAKISADKKIG